MITRHSTRWLTPLVMLAICGAAFAYNKIAATTVKPTISIKDIKVAAIDSTKAKQRPFVMPKVDWKPGQPWPGDWTQYPADDVLPRGLKIEVTAGVITGVITGVLTEEGDSTDYDVLGSRYVVGDLDATDITPALWRHFDLEMPKPDGSIAELSVVRPLWWMEETGAKVGETIDLGMQEIGISGEAKVLKVRRCDVDSRDNQEGSQIVTGKIKHHNAEVWDLVFNNDTSKPLGVTANHPIMSADRNDWVPAGELQINEQVKTTDGTVMLTSKSKHPTRETVYNLEVHRSHAYHVSQFGILAHNNNILHCTISPSKLQHEFKHAEHFGISGNWNKQTGKAFHDAIQAHVGRTDIQKITGTYRGTIKVTHHFDPATGLNVMVDEAGNLVGAWRLGKAQMDNLLRIGNVQ